MKIKDPNQTPRTKYLDSLEYRMPRIERHYWFLLTLFFKKIHFDIPEVEEYNIDKEGNIRISDGYYLYKYNKDAMIQEFELYPLQSKMDPEVAMLYNTIFYCYKHLYQLKLEEPNHSNKLNKKVIKDLKIGESINIYIRNNRGFKRIGLVKGDITKVTTNSFFYMDTYEKKETQFDNVIFYSNRVSLFNDKYIDGDEFELFHLSSFGITPIHTVELCSVIKEKAESLNYSI